MSAPHLPPQSCSVPLRRRLESIPAIILFTVLALTSSIAISLVVVSRFAFAPVSETKVVIAGTANKENATLDPSVVRDVREKTVTLLDMTKKSADSFTENAVLGQAALLSTDGWAVTAAALPVSVSQIRAVDAQGVLHTITTQRLDALSGLRYIKIQHDGFRIFDVLSDVPARSDALAIFSFDRASVRPLLLSQDVASDHSLFTVAQARMSMRVEPAIDIARVLVNDRGVLVGVSSYDGSVIPGVVIRHGLPFVLSGDTISIATLPFTVNPVIGIQRDTQVLPITGYIIHKIQPKRANETIEVGDILTRIDNKPVDETMLALLRYDTRQQIPVTVYRDGVEVDVVVTLLR